MLFLRLTVLRSSVLSGLLLENIEKYCLLISLGQAPIISVGVVELHGGIPGYTTELLPLCSVTDPERGTVQY